MEKKDVNSDAKDARGEDAPATEADAGCENAPAIEPDTTSRDATTLATGAMNGDEDMFDGVARTDTYWLHSRGSAWSSLKPPRYSFLAPAVLWPASVVSLAFLTTLNISWTRWIRPASFDSWKKAP
ncbi:hypothetical protein Pcac1_g15160 [Phytophthora cactorum]|nr:hypothetical protein Pcac1_g15160 [Phytophthora cactorum]